MLPLHLFVLKPKTTVFAHNGYYVMNWGEGFYRLPVGQIKGLWAHTDVVLLPSAVAALLANGAGAPQPLPPGIERIWTQLPDFVRWEPATEGPAGVDILGPEYVYGYWNKHKEAIPEPERDVIERIKKEVSDDIDYRFWRSWNYEDFGI